MRRVEFYCWGFITGIRNVYTDIFCWGLNMWLQVVSDLTVVMRHDNKSQGAELERA